MNRTIFVICAICAFGAQTVASAEVEETSSELIQKFTLHADERCQDHGESYTENVRNLGKVSRLVQAKTLRCACADFGVWSYSTKINYYGGEFGGSRLAVTKTEADKTCVTLGKNATILSIRKVGNSNVTVPAISFFVDLSLRGRELYFDGSFVELPWPILFRSVGFSGVNASWALYPTTDSVGAFTCMGQKESTLITYSSGSKMNLIGSVRRAGCLYPSGAVVDPSVNSDEGDEPTPSISLILRDRSLQLSTDSTELRLPYPITVYSVSFTGEGNWTLYRGILFNGKAKCVSSTGSGESGPQNFMDDAEEYPIGSLVVGSVKQGCHHLTSDLKLLAENEEDYPSQNDDIYDYEDGYGKVASSSSASSGKTAASVTMGIITMFYCYNLI